MENIMQTADRTVETSKYESSAEPKWPLKLLRSSTLICKNQIALNTNVLKELQAGKARNLINTILWKREIVSWRYYKTY